MCEGFIVVSCDLSNKLFQTHHPSVPPHPAGGLGGGDDDEDDDTYEEAEPYMAADTTMSNTGIGVCTRRHGGSGGL